MKPICRAGDSEFGLLGGRVLRAVALPLERLRVLEAGTPKANRFPSRRWQKPCVGPDGQETRWPVAGFELAN
jgi:hypothetical protein